MRFTDNLIGTGEYTSDSYTKLLVKSNAADGNQTFTDSGDTTHTLTAVSNVKHSSAQKRFGKSSIYVSNATSYITAPDHADYSFGTGDFTIDLWMYRSGLPATSGAMLSKYVNGGWILETGPIGSATENKIRWRDQDTGATNMTSGTLTDQAPMKYLQGGIRQGYLDYDKWYHIAVTRAGTRFRLFIDGVMHDMVDTSFNYVDGNMTETLFIGRYSSSAAEGFTGYLDEIRISKGSCRWQQNFNVPSTVGAVTADVYTHPVSALSGGTSLLIHSDAADGNQTFTDSSTFGHTITAVGDAEHMSDDGGGPIPIFGSTSMYFDGSDYLHMPMHAMFQWGYADFTVEFWMWQHATAAAYGPIFDTRPGSGDGIHLAYVNGTSNLRSHSWTGSNTIFSAAVSREEWHHCAFVRHQGRGAWFIDGIKSGHGAAMDISINGSSNKVKIGNDSNSNNSGPGNEYFRGWLDELRVTKGQALYTAQFTPPNTPFTVSAPGNLRYDKSIENIVCYDGLNWEPMGGNEVSENNTRGGTEAFYKLNGLTYKVHTFTSSGMLVVGEGIVADILIVGGGGAGGNTNTTGYSPEHGGGGGAGGMRAITNEYIPPGAHPVIVGSGGAGHDLSKNSDGSPSKFRNYYQAGGGAGGHSTQNGELSADDMYRGNNGGSGGGAHGNSGGTGGVAINSSYGNNGGSASAGFNPHRCGGGGGRGAAGTANVTYANRGTGGGAGATNDFRTGSNETYAVGGHAGTGPNKDGAGGTGNGGGGGDEGWSAGTPGYDDQLRTTGCSGGAGIVVVRYATT